MWQTSPRPAPTRKAASVAPLSSWAAHEQVWPFPSIKMAHYWASSSFTARRCGRSPDNRPSFFTLSKRKGRSRPDAAGSRPDAAEGLSSVYRLFLRLARGTYSLSARIRQFSVERHAFVLNQKVWDNLA